MKIFWSWQSDTHANTGRHFVRAALNEAIKQLRTPEDVEEPPEAARREELHVDAGRENVPGSPNLAETILAKIAISSALVADVTPVGFGLPRKKPDGTPMPPKPLMNPNVAIELGYALDKLSTYNVLMVLNTHYGDRSCLPFDLTHKAGPIEYSLAEDATREQIQTEHGKLKGNFVVALREMLKTEHGKLPAFQETENTTNIATFWQPGDVLARIEASPLRAVQRSRLRGRSSRFA